MDRRELQVAVDVGARRHRVAVGDATGRLIEEFDLSRNTRETRGNTRGNTRVRSCLWPAVGRVYEMRSSSP